jgi:hypothetical protein
MPGNKSSWHEYNESLIERGHFLIDIGFLKLRNKEIKSMNEGKVGAPYEYPDSYIQFLAFLKLGFRIPYRTVQGIVRGLSEYVKIEEMHFTQTRRRTLKIKACVEDTNFKDEPMLVVDASGLTMSKKGDYIEEKWRRNKKEFIKLPIAVDGKTKKIVSFRITKGNVHDSKKFVPLVRKAFERCSNIQKVYADKAHDNRKNFNLLDELNAEPAIGIRNNVSTRSRGRHSRTEELLLMKKPGYQGWKQLRMQG